jgi:hypothetical protein
MDIFQKIIKNVYVNFVILGNFANTQDIIFGNQILQQ